VQQAIEELQEEGFLIERIGSAVKNAFRPLTQELEDKAETKEMEGDLKEVQEILREANDDAPPPNPFTVAEVKQKSVAIDEDDKRMVVVLKRMAMTMMMMRNN
jgi:hypothetical protein